MRLLNKPFVLLNKPFVLLEKPFVVSLSNHERLDSWVFDCSAGSQLRPNDNLLKGGICLEMIDCNQ
jgi:hypothetical protein